MRKPKAAVTAEIVPRDRAQQADDFTRMVEQLVQQKVAEATEGRDALLQPWFQNREVANAIKRRQTVTEQAKWSCYFEDWGCIVCAARRTVAHCALGMCGTCYARTAQRLRATLRNHAPAPDQPQPTFMDTVELAREALGPSIKKLAASTNKKRNRKTNENSRSPERFSAARGGGLEEVMNLEMLSTMNPRQFSRVANISGHVGEVAFETSDTLDTLTKAFGSPQRRGPVFNWHFVRQDFAPGFSLAAERSSTTDAELKVVGYAETDPIEFYVWATDQMLALQEEK
jgi:hypothetical protein